MTFTSPNIVDPTATDQPRPGKNAYPQSLETVLRDHETRLIRIEQLLQGGLTLVSPDQTLTMQMSLDNSGNIILTTFPATSP